MQTCSLARFFLRTESSRSENEAPRPAPPPPRFARCASSSGPPPPLARGRKGEAFSRRVSVQVLCPAKRDRRNSSPFIAFTLCFFLPSQKKKGGGTPANAGRPPPHQATRHAPCGARSSVGVPPRFSPKGIIPSQRLSFRLGFLGRGLNGRYPPSPVPVQGCTSHPGHNAGRHDAQTAREQRAKPPAGTAPAPPFGLPPEGVLRRAG